MYSFFIEPFLDYMFLRRALVACFALALGGAPIGVLVVLRRMTLMGDALSHSIFPGVAIAFLLVGLSLPAMSLGGFLSALIVALLAGSVSRITLLKEDASLVGFYLLSLAFGSLVVSVYGTKVDLMHILLGSILAVDQASLLMLASIATLTLCVGSFLYRPLLMECFDPTFMKSLGAPRGIYHSLFIVLIVLNLVAAFHALGILMALGIMMMPAIAARFWSNQIRTLFVLSFGFAMMAAYFGLLFSFHYEWPSGPTIVLFAGLFYIFSLLWGPLGLLRKGQGV